MKVNREGDNVFPTKNLCPWCARNIDRSKWSENRTQYAQCEQCGRVEETGYDGRVTQFIPKAERDRFDAETKAKADEFRRQHG